MKCTCSLNSSLLKEFLTLRKLTKIRVADQSKESDLWSNSFWRKFESRATKTNYTLVFFKSTLLDIWPWLLYSLNLKINCDRGKWVRREVIFPFLFLPLLKNREFCDCCRNVPTFLGEGRTGAKSIIETKICYSLQKTI